MRVAMLLTLCLALAGCGAQGEPFQPERPAASKAVIYVYRPYKALGSQSIPMVTCGHESFELDPGGYYAIKEDPGPVACAVADSPAQYKFEAHPGEQYYIEEVVDESASGSHASLVSVRASTAQDEIKYCNREGIKR
jgi:hypothetical protein